MLNSDSVLSQIFWCFWCSIEFVLKDRIDLRWIGPLHETSIQLNYLGVDFIQTCSNEKNSWNSGFVVLCCCFPWRMDLVFEKSQLLLFFPPLTKKNKLWCDNHVPACASCPGQSRQTWLRLGTKNLELGKGEPVLQPHGEVGMKKHNQRGMLVLLVLQWS